MRGRFQAPPIQAVSRLPSSDRSSTKIDCSDRFQEQDLTLPGRGRVRATSGSAWRKHFRGPGLLQATLCQGGYGEYLRCHGEVTVLLSPGSFMIALLIMVCRAAAWQLCYQQA